MRGCVRWGFARSARRGDAAHAALRMGQEELDILLAAPATGWGEAVAKARYLLILFAQTPAAEDPRRATLIADVFADFKRLLAESKHSPGAGDAGLAPNAAVRRQQTTVEFRDDGLAGDR
jgi:hypothetical protein